MATEPVYESIEQADNSIPRCPRPCYLCQPGHHWYLDLGGRDDEWHDEDGEDEEDEEPADEENHLPDADEPEDAVACICKHCPARVYVSLDAEDLPEI